MSAERAPYAIGIIGVRDFKGEVYTNEAYVSDCLKTHIRQRELVHPLKIVTGGGRGVEGLVTTWAKDVQIPVRKIPPNIAQFGVVKAFKFRNNSIVSESDEVVIFWEGSTIIVTDAIVAAMQTGKRVTVFPLI